MMGMTDELCSSLSRDFHGELLRPGQSGFEDARGIWNGMFDRTPGLIARCADVADIRNAVRAASRAEVLTAVRCGGHSLAGFSTCDGGLVIDLSRMRQVTVDADARRARFAGGCLLGSVDTATQKAGLVFPAGVVSHTGAAGLVLGGGTGWLTRRFGLSCDNVEGFSLVTADGSIVHANAKENSDLFWALRGGGGNFGIVTEFEVKLHPLTTLVLAEGLTGEAERKTGEAERKTGEAEQKTGEAEQKTGEAEQKTGEAEQKTGQLGIRRLLNFWRDYMAEAPHDLKWNINLQLASHKPNVPAELRGKPVANSSLVWTGDPEAGRKHLDRALALCHPDSVSSKTVSYMNLQTMADADFPHGRRYYTKSGYFTYLDDATVDRLMAAVVAIPSPETMIELAYLGGAAGQVSAHETSFGDRSAPFVLTLLANWSDPSGDAGNIAWARGVFNQLRPAMKPGVYVNFMSGDEQERVPEAYHQRWDRMIAVKSHYDPDNFFRLNQNVKPQKTVARPG